jgi:hypothetical protein
MLTSPCIWQEIYWWTGKKSHKSYPIRFSGWVTKIIRCNPRFARNVSLVSRKSVNACVKFPLFRHRSREGFREIIILREYFVSMFDGVLTTVCLAISVSILST